MTAVLSPQPTIRTLADLLEQLGGIGPHRVRFQPPPGTATEDDLLDIWAREHRLCELVDGVLVEKPMGYKESALAVVLAAVLWAFVRPRKLGVVTGEAGMVRLFPKLIRIPDVAFASWDRLPGRRMPKEAVPHLAPNLVVEVLSESNTSAEIDRKCGEYFAAGVELVWIVDPGARAVEVYTSADQQPVVLHEADTLGGGSVLPGFSLALGELFGELDEQG